jgi:hypothetical protein
MQLTLWAPENPDEMNELATTLYNNGFSHLDIFLLTLIFAISRLTKVVTTQYLIQFFGLCFYQNIHYNTN